jgi:hypothetical protein
MTLRATWSPRNCGKRCGPRTPIDPIRRSHPGLTVDDAYAIPLCQVAAWPRDGDK